MQLTGLRHVHGHDPDDHDHDRDVEQERRTPPEALEQRTRHDGPDGAARTCEAGPDGDRPTPLLGREHGGHGGERGRHDERRTEACDASPDNDEPGGAGQTAEHGAGGEDAKAADERELATVAIPDRAGGQQDAREHEPVGVDDPLQFAGRRSQRTLDARDGDVEPRHRHHDENQRETQHPEREPASGVDLRILVQRGVRN